LWHACARNAIRLARHVGRLSRADAEDVVSDVYGWLWAHRAHLVTPPGLTYVFRTVKHGAPRWHRYAWRQRVIPMDPATLRVVEQLAYDPTAPPFRVPR
jgi:DNA-directed RNA polymerase specialized sigma24 family protein